MNKRETKMILRRYLHPLKEKQIDSLILGCTHYPLLKHLIQTRIGKKVQLIDSSDNLAKNLSTFLDSHPHLCEQTKPVQRLHFTTDITESAQKCANAIFQRNITLRRP
jgi:glutamate racemase